MPFFDDFASGRRNCPMDMSPSSIACREGRRPTRPVAPMPRPFRPVDTTMPIRRPPIRRPAPPMGETNQPIERPVRPPVAFMPRPFVPVDTTLPIRRPAPPMVGRPPFGDTNMPIARPAPPPMFIPDLSSPNIQSSDGVGASLEPMVGFGRKRRACGKKGPCGKTRKQGCRCNEMEGGFLGALASLGARLIPSLARGASSAASRAASSAASRAATAAASRSTALVPYNAATAARNAAAASRAATSASTAASSAARASMLSRLGTAASRFGTAASIGLPIGLSVYQAVDYEKGKEAQAQADALAERQAQEALALQTAQTTAELDRLSAEQKKAEAEYNALMEQRSRDAKEFEAAMRDIELERQRQAEADEETARQVALFQEQQKKAMEDAIARQAAQMAAYYANKFGPTLPTQPSRQPTTPVTPARPPPSTAPAPSMDESGLTARQRAALRQLRGYGRRKHM